MSGSPVSMHARLACARVPGPYAEASEVDDRMIVIFLKRGGIVCR